MPTTWVRFRTVVYDGIAQTTLDRQIALGDRTNEQMDGLEWLLSRTPEIGTPRQREKLNEHLLFVSRGDTVARTHDVWLLYSYDDQQVTIHGLKFVKAQVNRDAHDQSN